MINHIKAHSEKLSEAGKYLVNSHMKRKTEIRLRVTGMGWK